MTTALKHVQPSANASHAHANNQYKKDSRTNHKRTQAQPTARSPTVTLCVRKRRQKSFDPRGGAIRQWGSFDPLEWGGARRGPK